MHIKNLFINLADPTIFASFGGETFWERVKLPVNSVVVKEEEETQDFYYIVSGVVRVTKSLKDEKQTQKHLATLDAGNFFGEGALLLDGGRSASVQAVSDVELLKLSQKNFEDLVQQDATAAVGIVLGIVKVMSGRLKQMNDRLVALNNMAKLMVMFPGNAPQIIGETMKMLSGVVQGGFFALFDMEGMAKYTSEGMEAKVLQDLQMKIPDYASRLAQPGAPTSFIEGKLLFCAVHNLQGQLTGVLASYLDDPTDEENIRLLVTVAEQMGHLNW